MQPGFVEIPQQRLWKTKAASDFGACAMANCCINQHLNQPGNIQCIECGSLLAGALIGDYHVISYIGSGSSSDVYLAEQHSLNLRKVVIKVLHRSCNRQHVDNFQREAALLASLSHPYILPIFSYGV